MTKLELLRLGRKRVSLFCALNTIVVPSIFESEEPRVYNTCAFYRSGVILIDVARCAAIGLAGRQWSYPGYIVDRTPYGVLCHELGHHVDSAHGAAGGTRARKWREETGEPPITSYAPNANEWFAEMFRLYVTNPKLLHAIRPRAFARFASEWTAPETREWSTILLDSERHVRAATNKIAAAPKGKPRG